MDIDGKTLWLLIFDDGHPNRKSKKIGYIMGIKNGVIFFREQDNHRYQIIPLSRIIRIELIKEGERDDRWIIGEME